MYDSYEYVVGMHFHLQKNPLCVLRTSFQENANFVLAKGRVPKRVRKGHSTKGLKERSTRPKVIGLA